MHRRSLAQFGVSDGASLDLYTKQSDGKFVSPLGIRYNIQHGRMVLVGKHGTPVSASTQCANVDIEAGAGASSHKRTPKAKGGKKIRVPADGGQMGRDVDSTGACVSGDDDGSSSDDHEDDPPPPYVCVTVNGV